MSADGKQVIKSGYYNHQWKTQFQEKNLTSKKLQDKVEQLEQEIQMHQGTLTRTQKHMRMWKAVGQLASMKSSKPTAYTEMAGSSVGESHLDEEQEEFAHSVCVSRCTPAE